MILLAGCLGEDCVGTRLWDLEEFVINRKDCGNEDRMVK